MVEGPGYATIYEITAACTLLQTNIHLSWEGKQSNIKCFTTQKFNLNKDNRTLLQQQSFQLFKSGAIILQKTLRKTVNYNILKVALSQKKNKKATNFNDASEIPRLKKKKQ